MQATCLNAAHFYATHLSNPDSGHWKWEDYTLASIFTPQISNTNMDWNQWFLPHIELNNEGEFTANSGHWKSDDYSLASIIYTANK